MSVITTQDLTNYMSEETLDTGRATLVVAAVNEHIKSTTGRSWGETTTVTETYDLAPTIFLNHQDVKEVTLIETGQGNGQRTTLDADSYFINPLGRLVLSTTRAGFNRTLGYVHVTYKYGTGSVPGDLKLAALALASDYYSYAEDGGKEVSSEGVGSYSVTYKSGTQSASGSNLNAIITSYRTRRV